MYYLFKILTSAAKTPSEKSLAIFFLGLDKGISSIQFKTSLISS
jgi:hypothetical protein